MSDGAVVATTSDAAGKITKEVVTLPDKTKIITTITAEKEVTKLPDGTTEIVFTSGAKEGTTIVIDATGKKTITDADGNVKENKSKPKAKEAAKKA